MKKLHPYQVEARKVIIDCKGQAGLFMAPGTGKTLTTIRYINKFKQILIICRRDDFMTWYDQLTEDGWKHEDLLIIDKARGKDFEETLTRVAKGDYRVVMVTYDLVKNKRVRGMIMSQKWDACVADECHLLKRWKAARTKTVVRATRHIPRRIGLTGSPITNDPIDVYSICLFIDDGRTFGNNEWHFKKKYYLQSGRAWYKKRTAKDLIAERLKVMAFHVHEDDVLKLPKKRELIEYCPMLGMQRRLYEKVVDEWELQLKSGEVMEINHTMVRLEKLKQIASGFYITPPDEETGVKETVYMKSGKLNKLEKMLSDDDYLGTHKKVVVWCSRTAEIMMIYKMAREKLKCQAVRFHGSKRRVKEKARTEFRDNPKVRLFIGQVDAGVGMNELVVASDAVYFSNSTKVVSRQQSMRRTRRIGSEHHEACTYWDLVAEGTADMAALKNIKGSMNVAQSILNQIKKGKSIRAALRDGF